MAIDGETGKIKWTYAPEVDFSQSTGVGGYGISVNRGIAHEDGKLFVLTFDDQLQAISAKTGEKIWSSEVADPATGAYQSMAPTAYDGKVYVGVSGSEDGVRGFLAAYDQKTGKKIWQFYTVPKQGEGWVPKGGGGGTIYMPPTVDAEDQHDLRRHRQPGPGDRRRRTARQEPLHRLDHRPRRRHRQAQVVPPGAGARPLGLRRRVARSSSSTPKSNGEMTTRRRRGRQERPALPARRRNRRRPLPAGPVRQTAPHQADDEADPAVPRPGRRLAVLAARLQPGNRSGLRLRDQPLLLPQGRIRTEGQRRESLRRRPRRRPGRRQRPAPSPPSRVTDGKVLWKKKMPTPMDGGATASAGGLVFTGDQKGVLYGFDAKTGDTLYEGNLGLAFGAAPVIYSIGDTEYVLVDDRRRGADRLRRTWARRGRSRGSEAWRETAEVAASGSGGGARVSLPKPARFARSKCFGRDTRPPQHLAKPEIPSPTPAPVPQQLKTRCGVTAPEAFAFSFRTLRPGLEARYESEETGASLP